MSRTILLCAVTVALFAVAAVATAEDLPLKTVVGEPRHDARRGTTVYSVRSACQRGQNVIEVLLPDAFRRDKTYPVLYVLPVETGVGGRYGDGLMEVKRVAAHDRHQLICVSPAFDTIPWYADHDRDLAIRHETYMRRVVVPLIERRYPVRQGRAGRLLLGFSKSGWGAFTLTLRHPEFFGYAAAWDAPLMLPRWQKSWGMDRHFGSEQNFDRYSPPRIFPDRAGPFRSSTRLVLLGEKNFGRNALPKAVPETHTAGAHRLMLEHGIRHAYRDDLSFDHSWGSGWVKPAVDELMKVVSSARPGSKEQK